MKIISNRLHGVLDYCCVYFLLIAPLLFDMKKQAALFTWVLGTVHLLLTLATDFELGVLKLVPLQVHAKIEWMVALALPAAAIYFHSVNDDFCFYFYIVLAVFLFVTGRLSQYTPAKPKYN